MSKCASCKHWNVFNCQCAVTGWPVAASHGCPKWVDAREKEKDCGCPATCENRCAGCTNETKDVLDRLADMLMEDLDD